MKILILTPLNPILSGSVYTYISDKLKYNKNKVGILCFPFFAEMRSTLTNTAYLINLFAMLSTSLLEEEHKKLYNKETIIVIGNTYKDEKFDIIISYNEDLDSEFDTYIKLLETDNDFIEIKEKVKPENLYKIKDAEINMPTLEHLLLFLEGVIKDGIE